MQRGRPAARAAPAPLLRRVDREPRAARLSCCTRRTSSATPTPSRMARDHREAVQRGLAAEEGRQRDRRAARRARDPSDQRPRRRLLPRPDAGRAARRSPSELAWARDAALETVRWVAGFEFPDFEPDYEFVALRHPDEYPMNEGRIVSSGGLDIAAREYDAHFVEEHVPHSNALHATLARARRLPGAARSPATPSTSTGSRRSPARRRAPPGSARSCRNPFQQHRRARGRDAVGVRRGAAHHRRLRAAAAAARSTSCRARRPATRPPRRRAASSTTAIGSTRTARILDAQDRAADLAEPEAASRRTSPASCRRGSRCPRRAR